MDEKQCTLSGGNIQRLGRLWAKISKQMKRTAGALR